MAGNSEFANFMQFRLLEEPFLSFAGLGRGLCSRAQCGLFSSDHF